MWSSPGQNIGVGSFSLLQGIFPTQGSNPGLSYCRWILYQLSHKRSPRILEWVAYPFSRGSSRPRNQTRVSCIAGGFFTNWAFREALRRKGRKQLKGFKLLTRAFPFFWESSSLHGNHSFYTLSMVMSLFSKAEGRARTFSNMQMSLRVEVGCDLYLFHG